MARKELSRVFSKTLCLLVLANADFSRALIDDCVDFDLAHLDQCVSASLDTWSTQGNPSGPAKHDTGSLERFGTLKTDWTRLSSLRDALPEDSILKRRFSHLHRLLLVAHEQASASGPREFPASPTGSTTTAIVSDHEAALEATATTESRNTSNHQKDNGTAVSSHRDAGSTPSFATLETSSSTRSVHYRSRVTQANGSILAVDTSNETTTLTSSQENATPASPRLTSSSVSTSSSTPDASGSSPDGESRENPYGDSATTRGTSPTMMTTDDIVFLSPKQNDPISMTPSSLAAYSSTPAFLTSPYTKDQTSTIVNGLHAKTPLIETKELSSLALGDVSPETTTLRSTAIVQPTPIATPMSISESSILPTTTKTSENIEPPIPPEVINVLSNAKEAPSNETRTSSTLKADDRVDESSSLPSPTEPTKSEIEDAKTSSKNETKSPNITGQPYERAEPTKLWKFDAQETAEHPCATSHEADHPTSTSMASEWPSTTRKTMEEQPTNSRLAQRQNPTRRSYELVEDRSTSLIDLGYTSSPITPQHIRNVPNFQKNTLRKSSSRIKEISRDYRHETAEQLGRVQSDPSQGVYELAVGAENRTFWRQRLERQSPLKGIQRLASVPKESGPATIFSPGAQRKQEASSVPENLRVLEESSTRSSLQGRTNRLRPRRRGSSGDSGKRFKTFYAREQFEDRGGSRVKEEEATKIKIQCKSS